MPYRFPWKEVFIPPVFTWIGCLIGCIIISLFVGPLIPIGVFILWYFILVIGGIFIWFRII